MVSCCASNNGHRWPSLLLWITVLFLSVITVADLTSGGSKPESTKRINFKKNVNTAKQWSCKHPQPRLVYISQLDEYAAPNVVYLPSALLVHRCDDAAGCCMTPGHTCTSVEYKEELVNYAVHAVYSSEAFTLGRNGQKQKKEKKITVSLQNHTLCECVGRNNLRSRRWSNFLRDLESLDLPI